MRGDMLRFICLSCFCSGSVAGVCRLVFYHWGAAALAPIPHRPPSPPIKVLSSARSSHPSAEDAARDKPWHSAAGWGIDLPLPSSHRSASLSPTWWHTARLLLLIVYMAPPVGQCIISSTYLQLGMTAASSRDNFICQCKNFFKTFTEAKGRASAREWMSWYHMCYYGK